MGRHELTVITNEYSLYQRKFIDELLPIKSMWDGHLCPNRTIKHRIKLESQRKTYVFDTLSRRTDGTGLCEIIYRVHAFNERDDDHPNGRGAPNCNCTNKGSTFKGPS